jgi:hypothetical protein
VVTIYFITKLHRKMKQRDSIMVVVDKLNKTVLFIPVKTKHKATNIAYIYMKEVVRLHGVPKEIVSDRDSKFTSKFWPCLFKGFGKNMNLSMTHHPDSDGKTKRTNKIIEDMLRMYVMDHPSKWEDFSYNNGYQASLKMSPFEALYGSKCNTPMNWDKPTDRAIIGPYLLKEMEEKMTRMRHNLKDTQDRKKSYGDKNKFFRDFKVEEDVFLKVKAKISSIILGCFPKLAARYCGSFEMLEKIISIAYMLSLLASMRVYNIFHVSILNKYVLDPNHINDWTVIQVENKWDFRMEPVCILDQKVKVLWNKFIGMVKVQWTCYGPEDATWECEETMWEEYLQMFTNFEENRS